MTISRLLILQVMLALGLGSVYLIPRETKIQPCRVNMTLPEFIGGWAGKPAAVTQKEHDELAPDTKFARKVYEDGLGDQVFVSIVLSGHDLDNSIHRPERCLPAQGWTIQDSSVVQVPVPEAPGGVLPATRLHNFRQVDHGGHVGRIYNLNYYWFIGYSDITPSHLKREYIDMKDRLLHGYNQRWAFVTVAASVTKGMTENGRDEAETDKMIQGLIAQVYPLIVTQTGSGSPDQ